VRAQALILCAVYLRHEAMSWLVFRLYRDDYSTCDASGLVFRCVRGRLRFNVTSSVMLGHLAVSAGRAGHIYPRQYYPNILNQSINP
jgi:hypothetical protein